jgi:hypothetical protein
MSQGKQKENERKKIKIDFFAEDRNRGNKNKKIEIKSIKRITYPKITLVIARYAIEREARMTSFHEIVFC